MTKVKAWWFADEDNKLRYGDDRVVRKGITHKVSKKQKLELCFHGLHGSSNVLDALFWFSTYHSNKQVKLWRVELTNATKEEEGKRCAYERKYLFQVKDPLILIRNFLFRELLLINKQNKYDFPEIVVSYLQDPQPNLHRKVRIAITTYVTQNSYNSRDTCTLLFYIEDCIPVKNQISNPSYSSLKRLFSAITYYISESLEDLIPSEAEIDEWFVNSIRTAITIEEKAIIKHVNKTNHIVKCIQAEYKTAISNVQHEKLNRKLNAFLVREGQK